MEERNNIVKRQFPAVVADIIIDYATTFKRPFIEYQCLVCGENGSHTKLCDTHHYLCLFCCDNIPWEQENHLPHDINPVCKTCEIRYKPLKWFDIIVGACNYYGENLYETFYRNDEYPVDIEYLIQNLRFLKMIREEGKKYDDESKKYFEQRGGIKTVRKTVRHLPNRFEDTEIVNCWHAAEQCTGTYTWSVILNIIRKRTC